MNVLGVLVGLVLIIGGIAAGIYVGIFWALIGGIVQAYENWGVVGQGNTVAIGIVKALLFETIGGLTALVGIIPGIILIKASE